MSAISPIQSAPASAASRNVFATSRSDAAVLSKLSPSAIVKLSAEGAAAARNPGAPDTATLIAANLASSSVSARFSGLGEAMLSQFKGENEGGNVKMAESARTAPAGMRETPYGAAIAAAGSSLHGAGDDRITLSITTVSGVQVTLGLDNQADGLAVQMSSSGDLSDGERTALAGLAGAFQQAIDGISQQPPKIRLEGLTQFDPSVLASVDLRASVQLKGTGNGSQTLEFRADATQRKVSLDGPSGSATMQVDTANLAGVGSAERQAKAVGSYLKQVEQAAARGHGDPTLVSMFKDAFAGMHGNIGDAGTGAGWGQTGKLQLAPEDHAAMTGLADFSASMTQTPDAINPMRPGEQDHFTYNTAQSTSVGGRSQAERTVSQQQSSELAASFHTPTVAGVSLALGYEQASQNYNYHQIKDSASSEVRLAYREGLMVSATLDQSATQSARVMNYVAGSLASDKLTPGKHSVQRDLLAGLAPHRANERGLSEEERSDRRARIMDTLGEQVLLQAYPLAVSGVASGETAPV